MLAFTRHFPIGGWRSFPLAAAPRGRLFLPLLFCLAIYAFLPFSVRAAGMATVDQFDGYSNKILDKVLKVWSPPLVKGDYQMRLQVSIDDVGKVVECKAIRGSGYQTLDNYACHAFKEASPFGTPPYGMPIETYFAMWSGNPAAKAGSKTAKAAAKEKADNKEKAAGQEEKRENGTSLQTDAKYKSYLASVARKLRDSMYIPEKTKKGVYHVTARVKCDSSGKIISSSILEGSGDSLLDKYVLQGIKRAKSIKAPPAGLGDTLDLTFTLQRL